MACILFKIASLSSAVTPKPPDNRIEVFVDDKPVMVTPGITVLQVCFKFNLEKIEHMSI